MLTLLASGALLAADIDPKDVEAMKEAAKNAHWRPLGIELPLLLGALLGVALLLFVWAFFIRKRPKHSRGSLILTRAAHSAEAVSADGRRRRRKRRPEHPDNWGRNPTLGETGGLPPVRPEDSAPPESSST
jgi:hypothetical protein